MARRGVAVRREEILDATVALIDAEGLSAVRVKDVAQALGISPGLVFYHFDTKDALLVAAFRHAAERDLALLQRTTRRHPEPVARLGKILTTYGPVGRAAGWRIWIDGWALAQREPSIRRVLRDLDQQWTACLAETIRDGVAAGDFVCADADAAAARLNAVLDGLAVAALVQRTVTRADLKTWARECAAREVGVDPDRLG